MGAEVPKGPGVEVEIVIDRSNVPPEKSVIEVDSASSGNVVSEMEDLESILSYDHTTNIYYHYQVPRQSDGVKLGNKNGHDFDYRAIIYQGPPQKYSSQQDYKSDFEYARRASIFHPQSRKDMVPDKAISMTMMVEQALAILKVHKDMFFHKAIGMTLMAERHRPSLKSNTKIWYSSRRLSRTKAAAVQILCTAIICTDLCI
ncbi:hypothetical protein Tco_1352242 [Tanacetum coccineum]